MADDSPSPATSVSSDKENHTSQPVANKGKGRASMGPPRIPSPDRNRRKRPSDQNHESDRAQRLRTIEREEELEYDPDQPIEERRKLRKEMRNLTKELQDSRIELLQPESTTLRDIITKANDYAGQVKQTSDATIDSRLLVQAADLSYKKTLALISGDNSQGIDMDEFISRCRTYMRGGNGFVVDEEGSATQRRRRANDLEDEEDIDGDMLDWEYLGRTACVKYTQRPSVPGFLLGPLSVQKRAKRVVLRKAAFRPNSIKETRPEVVEIEDIEKRDNANLASLCPLILEKLETYHKRSAQAVDDLIDDPDNISQKETEKILDRFGIDVEGGVGLYRFMINPESFGQTVENMFYTSFLIKEGALGIVVDDRGLPYLRPIEKDLGKRKARGEQAKHQAILSMDMALWKELIDVFDIKDSIIPHREEEEHSNVGKKGWYA